MGDNICKSFIHQRINIHNVEAVTQPQNKKSPRPFSSVKAQGLEWIIPKEIQTANKREKVLNPPNHQGNENVNPFRMAATQKRMNAGEDVEKGEHAYTVGGNIN